ncbi:hypothetical protein SASPL_128907 [Salvia splendens]|uniref:Uncharacterized protein n=1 Tax=Salvia splendens TaxID=180675 RepID=A0A8X8XF23_SALSN|nr:hypothetical protein SASPL_128907 [Salvia splendens]
MDPIMPLSQTAFLYVDGWEPKDDHLLLEYLEIEKVIAEKAGQPVDFTGPFVEEVHAELAEEFAKWHEPAVENEFVIAYYLRDEPEYDRLLWVFGPDAASKDDMGEVVGPSKCNGRSELGFG